MVQRGHSCPLGQWHSVCICDQWNLLFGCSGWQFEQNSPTSIHCRPCGGCSFTLSCSYSVPWQESSSLLPTRLLWPNNRVINEINFRKKNSKIIFSRLGFSDFLTVEELVEIFPDLDYIDHNKRKILLVCLYNNYFI